MWRKIIRKIDKKLDLLEDLKMLQVFLTLLNFNFIMIDLIHKISVSRKVTQITLKIIF